MKKPWREFGLVFLSLTLLLLGLFHQSFESRLVHFSNDGPLGAISAKYWALPGVLTGVWSDSGFLGSESPSTSPDLSTAIDILLGAPLNKAKFFPPICLLLVGACAWVFFRQLKFRPWTCALASIAAALNSNVFSNVCWGQTSRAYSLAVVFLALAALQSGMVRRFWLKAVLAGAAVGLGIMEGFDVGALYSLLVGLFAVVLVWIGEGSVSQKLLRGTGRVAVVAIIAGFVATHVLYTLLNTQVFGVIGGGKDEQNSEQQWNFATQWSLPRSEALRVIIPGLYGYRMVDEGSRLYEASYWGRVGEQPGYWEHHQGFPRHSGAGEYAGVLVVLLAGWGLAQSFRKKGGPFTDFERRAIWFWGIMAVIYLITAFGRFGPLYRLFYSLPYMSSIRNPIKFMHMFHLAVIILSAYGLDALARRYWGVGEAKAMSLGDRLQGWWKRLDGYDKGVIGGGFVLFAISVLGWMLYASSRKELQAHLMQVGFPDERISAQMAAFSIHEVGLYVMFFALTLASLVLILSGFFAGKRAWLGGLLLGTILVLDMGRANQWWIIYSDYKQKLESNPIVDFLMQKPYEARVAGMNISGPPLDAQSSQIHQMFATLYYQEWLQHLFLYYNIQTIDYAQAPRLPEDYAAIRATFSNPALLGRYWQFTNTRYLVGMRSFVDYLNNQFDPVLRRFTVKTAFDLVPKAGIQQPTKLEELTAEPRTNGTLALIEWGAAMPRAQLFSKWQVVSNEATSLQMLSDLKFNPTQTALVTSNLPTPPTTEPTNRVQRPVEFISYAPKEIKIRAHADVPSLLLYNDYFSQNWKVTVDGQPDTIFRANFLMRGVYLKPGDHEVVYRFKPRLNSLYLSLAGIGLSMLIGLFLLVEYFRSSKPKD